MTPIYPPCPLLRARGGHGRPFGVRPAPARSGSERGCTADKSRVDSGGRSAASRDQLRRSRRGGMIHESDVDAGTAGYVTIIVVMSDLTLPLAEIKKRLSEIVDGVEQKHDRVVLTRNGRPAAVILSPDDLESLEETLAILSNPERDP